MNCYVRRRIVSGVVTLVLAVTVLVATSQPASAFRLRLLDIFIDTNPVFSQVENFEFTILIDEPLRIGVYDNPVLSLVSYTVGGLLAPGVPSGFNSFGLSRNIAGDEFYDQGSSLRFEIAETADFTDGLQVSELVGDTPVFVFNGREVGTGRYHPSLLKLNADGSGSLRNSNNTGGINPATGQMVNADFGDEYITKLSFVPDQLRLVRALGNRGDFDANGRWECADIDTLVSAIVAGTDDMSFDMNVDGRVNFDDLVSAGTGWLDVAGKNNFKTTGGSPFLPGDFNLDGAVDNADFDIWNAHRFSAVDGYCSGDADATGFVDGFDFVAWNENKTLGNPEEAVVPEPAAALLMLICLSASCVARRTA